MEVQSIYLYPVKGLKAISVDAASAQERGFHLDRRWMLMDNDGHFLSQRNHPRMALIKQSITNHGILLEYGKESVIIPFEAEGKEVSCQLFENRVHGLSIKGEWTNWLSEILGSNVQVLWMNDQITRHKKLVKGPEKTEVSFADGYPYLFLSTASMDLLNGQLSAPLSHDRFRCNIYVRANHAHVEDEWDKISIGQAIFQIIKPCARCQVISIDQQTAIGGKEPLRVLSTYRKKENKVFFGVNAICLQAGKVKIGDVVKPINIY